MRLVSVLCAAAALLACAALGAHAWASEPVLLPIVKPFACPEYTSPPNATHVLQLRPGNIKAIMALGDSMTAGFAMRGEFPGDILEWRDHVYSIGGNPKAAVLPQFLKRYNPGLVGAAQSVTAPLTKGAWLDAAVSEAKVEGVPSQIDYLVKTLASEYPEVGPRDWKLLTLFIGANNLCESCTGHTDGTPAYFESHLRSVMEQIKTDLPYTFVNVMTIFNISGVYHAGETKEYCKILWSGLTNGECGCLTNTDQDRQAMDNAAVAFNAITRKVVGEYSAHVTNSTNFHAVVQPGVEDMDIVKWGEHFLSDLDCFHPNVHADHAFALQLWNNMWQTPGSKSTTPSLNGMAYHCPGPNDFLQ